MKRPTLPPWYFLLPALVAGLGVVIPIAHLVLRALEVDQAGLREIVFRRRNLDLFAHTTGLAAAVVACSTLVAAPLAWLTTRTDLRGRHLVTLLSILPLSIPGYVVGYALLGLGSPDGPFSALFGSAPRISGFVGAVAALVIYNFPIVYLHLRTAFAGMDPSLTEAARSLGLGPTRSFMRITLPQLWPGYLSAVLLVTLYVLGDFGVVSLMRFETFSYAMYLQYVASYDRAYAAWLGLMLLTVTAVLLVAEFRLLRDLSLERTGRGSSSSSARASRLGAWQWGAYGFIALVTAASVLLPMWSIIYWMGHGRAESMTGEIIASLIGTLRVSVPAALLATVFAVPLAYLSRRHPSAASQLLERSAYVGYATPALALALGIVFVVLRAVPWLYQTAGLLVFAYTVHFMAQAIGPVRAGLHRATPHLEEASRALGLGPLATFRRVTLPILRPGLAAAAVLVFLSCVKELPLTFILAPLNFENLALNVYSYTTEAMFGEAAPYALTIVLLSASLTSIVFRKLGETR